MVKTELEIMRFKEIIYAIISECVTNRPLSRIVHLTNDERDGNNAICRGFDENLDKF